MKALPASLKGLTVLVVEDEIILFLFAEDILTGLGCDAVWHASRVAEALSLLETRHPDIAMLDVNLAGETGYPVAAALAARGIPFIFVTGYGTEGMPREWADRPVVQKPFAPALLAKAFQEALARGTARKVP